MSLLEKTGRRRVALTVRGEGDLASLALDPRFGRAEAFLFVDLDGGDPVRVANPAVDAAEGAGPASAAKVHHHGATDVISGRYGPKAARALASLGVRAWTTEASTAAEALAALVRGELRGER